MTLNDFINTYNGKGIDTDGAYGYQCMDLMHAYVRDVLGMGTALFAAPTAYEAYLSAKDSRFDKIGNTPAGVPQPGDIIFWDRTVGSAGHVAIFIDGNTQQFRSFDQNWPTGSVSHVQTHNYNGVAGWLHPKTAAPQPQGEETMNQQQVNDLYLALLGRPANDPGAANWIGQPWSKAFYEIKNSAEGQAHAAAVAQTATDRDNWKATAEKLQAIATDQSNQIKALQTQVTDLQSQIAAQGGDTVQLNALGSALKWFIQRLGLK